MAADSYGYGVAINARGWIVGFIDDTFGWPSSARAFLWIKGDDTPIYLEPDEAVSSAGDINDRGEIVGTTGDCPGSQLVIWRLRR